MTSHCNNAVWAASRPYGIELKSSGLKGLYPAFLVYFYPLNDGSNNSYLSGINIKELKIYKSRTHVRRSRKAKQGMQYMQDSEGMSIPFIVFDN